MGIWVQVRRIRDCIRVTFQRRGLDEVEEIVLTSGPAVTFRAADSDAKGVVLERFHRSARYVEPIAHEDQPEAHDYRRAVENSCSPQVVPGGKG